MKNSLRKIDSVNNRLTGDCTKLKGDCGGLISNCTELKGEKHVTT